MLRLPRIVGAPPSGYPNVFAVIDPEFTYMHPEHEDWFPRNALYGENNEFGSGGAPADNKELYEARPYTSNCFITYGPWVREYYDVQTLDENYENIAFDPTGIYGFIQDQIKTPMPFIHGSTDKYLWVGLNTQTAWVYWLNNVGDGSGHEKYPPKAQPTRIACSIVRGDGGASGADGATGVPDPPSTRTQVCPRP